LSQEQGGRAFGEFNSLAGHPHLAFDEPAIADDQRRHERPLDLSAQAILLSVLSVDGFVERGADHVGVAVSEHEECDVADRVDDRREPLHQLLHVAGLFVILIVDGGGGDGGQLLGTFRVPDLHRKFVGIGLLVERPDTVSVAGPHVAADAG